MWWELRLNRTRTLSQQLKSDRALEISEVRTIKHQSRHEPDERVVKITMELTAAEIMEIELALDNHIDRMTKNNWHYGEIKTVQRVLKRALGKLRDSNGK